MKGCEHHAQGITSLTTPRKMRQGCVLFNTSFLPLLEEIAMKVQSWQGPAIEGSSPGLRAAFPDLVHVPKAEPHHRQWLSGLARLGTGLEFRDPGKKD